MAEINGFTFCAGVSRMNLSYGARPGLLGLIRSVTYLIRSAIFRPTYKKGSPNEATLGELIDMYHSRQATVRHDKVFALLGMSTDEDIGAAGLLPDYTVSWQTLLQRVVRLILGKEPTVETWDDKQMAVIKSKGCVLGKVISAQSDSARYDRQHVKVESGDSLEAVEFQKKWGETLTLRSSAKSIRPGDLVCLLQGASKPTIVRAGTDHFTIIMIAAVPKHSAKLDAGRVGGPLPPTAKSPPREFLMLWDWENSTGQSASSSINTLVPELTPTTPDEEATRLFDLALILSDLEEYEEAGRRFQEAAAGVAKQNPAGHQVYELAILENTALVHRKRGRWAEAETALLQVIETRKQAHGASHADTLNSIANLASTYLGRVEWAKADPVLAKSLTSCIRHSAPISEKQAAAVALSDGSVARWPLGSKDSPDTRLLTLLLDLENSFEVTEEVLKAAAGNELSGRYIVPLLLDKRADVHVTEGILIAAQGNDRHWKEVIMELIEKRGRELQITERVVEAAVQNYTERIEMMTLLLEQGGEAKITDDGVAAIVKLFNRDMVELLLDKRGDVRISEVVIQAAMRNVRSGENMLKLMIDRRKDMLVTEEVVTVASWNQDTGKSRLMLLLSRGIPFTDAAFVNVVRLFDHEVVEALLDRQGDDVRISEAAIKAAARNGAEVMALLLNRRDSDVQITQEVLAVAAANGREGEAVLSLLLNRQGDGEEIIEEVTLAAAKNFRGAGVMRLLLDSRGDRVQVTEDVLKAAAKNWKSGAEMVKLLLDRGREKLLITEEIVQAVVQSSDLEVTKSLLDRRRDDVHITEGVLAAVATNTDSKEQVLKLLLDRRGDDMHITEEIVARFARSFDQWGMTLLLDQRGVDLQITEAVVKAAAQNAGVMKVLLDRRGDEIRITEGVIVAAAYNASVMTLLLDRRGDEVQAVDGVVAIIARLFDGNVMRLLLNRGVGSTQITEGVLKEAASNVFHSKEMFELLHQFSDIGVTPGIIETAATSGHIPLLQLFDGWGNLGPNREQLFKIARLYYATRLGKANEVRELLSSGAPPDERNIRGETPLGAAAQQGYVEVIQALLATGLVNINSQDKYGQTPLFHAVARGHTTAVQLLMDHGADQSLTDNEGMSPLSLARNLGFYPVADILAKHTVL